MRGGTGCCKAGHFAKLARGFANSMLAPHILRSVSRPRSSRGSVGLVIFAVLLGLGVSPAAAQESSEALFDEGVALREAGDLDGAIDRLRRAYRADGDDRTGYNLAVTLADAGQLVEARALAQRILATEPDLLIADALRDLVASVTPRIAAVSVSAPERSAERRFRRISLAVEQGPEPELLVASAPVEEASDDTWLWVGIGGGIAVTVALTVVLGVVLAAGGSSAIDGDLEDVRVRGRD